MKKKLDINKLYQVHREIATFLETPSRDKYDSLAVVETRYGEHLLDLYKKTLIYGMEVSNPERISVLDDNGVLYVSTEDTGTSVPYGMVRMAGIDMYSGCVYLILK